MFCSNCGKELSEGLHFCTFCGTPVSEPEENAEPKKDQQNSVSHQQGDIADVLKKSMASGGLFNALSGIAFGVILIYWISVFFDKLSAYKEDYIVQFCELEYGYIFYVLFFIIAIAVCIKGLVNILANSKATKSLVENKYLAPISKTKFSTMACMGVLLVENAILEIIRKIIGDEISYMDSEEFKIVMFKICYLYKDVIKTSLWISLVILIIGVLANSINKSKQSE